MSKITKPGIYDIAKEQYHGDCCAGPSLSSSGAVSIVNECPAKFFHSSYLNPSFVHEEKRAFDIGNAAHLIVLEQDQFKARVQLIDADDYRKDAAKEAREAAYKAGLTPLLPHELQTIRDMRKALEAHPIASLAFRDGSPEKTLAWQDEVTGMWCKARPDWMPNSPTYLIDYKTTANANPDSFERHAAGLGYYQRADWYLDGVQAVTGKRPERFAIIAQETKEPYLISVFWIAEDALGWGGIQNAKARAVFAECVAAGQWPGYRPIGMRTDAAFNLGLPVYVQRDLQAKHGLGAYDPFHKILNRGATQ